MKVLDGGCNQAYLDVLIQKQLLASVPSKIHTCGEEIDTLFLEGTS